MKSDMQRTTWGILLREATGTLEAQGVPDARRAVLWMLGEVLGCSQAHLLAYPERGATPEQVRRLRAMVARRLLREPLQYILGYAEFYGLRLGVTPAVLIPRPETEQVVEVALDLLQGRFRPRVLDVGTGSGCIALAIKHERPDADVAACDVSEDALRVARTNAGACALAVTFFHADILAADLPNPGAGPFDLIVSNPPYLADEEAGTLAPEVLGYEPHRALFAGEDPLLYYRALAVHAQKGLADGGALVVETHADHAGAVCEVLRRMDFFGIQSENDFAGLPRIVIAHGPAG